MVYKVHLGNGKYCYTVNCKKHSNNTVATTQQVTQKFYQEVTGLVDRNDPEWSAYYEGTEKKHLLDPEKPGSKFTDPNLKTLEDVLALTLIQRKNLDGDDRQFFIDEGTDVNAFMPGFRYLKVSTPGKLGIVHSSTLDESAVISVERTKPGAPCNFVINVSEQPTVDYGVVILEGSGNDSKLITMFPGAPTYVSLSSSNKERVNSWEGTSLTVSELRKRMGRDVVINTRLVQS